MKRMPLVFSRIRCVCRSALPFDFNNAYHMSELILEQRGSDLTSWQTIPPRLCATNASGLVLYKNSSSKPSNGQETYAVCAISQVGKRRQKLLTVVPDRILGCHRPKIDDVGIVAVHDDPGLGEIVGEK